MIALAMFCMSHDPVDLARSPVIASFNVHPLHGPYRHQDVDEIVREVHEEMAVQK